MDKITAFGTYKIYLALNLHFSQEKYDAGLYNYNVKAQEDKFNNSPNAFWFNGICNAFNGNKDEIINAFLAQHAMRVKYGGLRTRKDIFVSMARERQGRLDSLTETLKDNLSTLRNRLWHGNTDSPPILADLFKIVRERPTVCHYAKSNTNKEGFVSPETICILDKYTKFVLKCGQHIQMPIMWAPDRLFYTKYQSYVPKIEDHKAIILDYFPITHQVEEAHG